LAFISPVEKEGWGLPAGKINQKNAAAPLDPDYSLFSNKTICAFFRSASIGDKISSLFGIFRNDGMASLIFFTAFLIFMRE